MNSKRFSISIPEPCSENWEEMMPCERGRFCGSCQKMVIDFTTWSDAALADFFVRKENQNVCGRFYKHQIEDKIFSCIAPLKKPYRTLAMAASVAALTVVSATASAQTQKKTAHPSVFTPKKNTKQLANKPTSDLKEVVIKSPRYERPLLDREGYSRGTVLIAEEIEKMPVRALDTQIKNNVVLKKGKEDDGLIITESSSQSSVTIVDGLQHSHRRNIFQRIGT